MVSVIGIIPARYKSSRFPGKMLALVAGKPLIQHTYENAKRCATLDRLLVATDHEAVAACVRDFGGEVVMTSVGCSSGTARLAEVINQHLSDARSSILVNIQGDWPCLQPEAITAVVDLLRTDWGADIGTAAVPLTCPDDLKNPAKVKCLLDQRGRALYFTRQPLPASPAIYGHLGLYSYRFDFLRRFPALKATPLERLEDLEQLRALEQGYEIGVAIMEQSGLVSIDTPDDVAKVEEYLCNQSTYSLPEASSPHLAKV